MRNLTDEDADKMFGPHVPSMDGLPGKTVTIRLRRWDTLWQLPAPHEHYVTPLDIGGWSGSYHSDDLSALARAGLVERAVRSSGYRGSRRYRLTVDGFVLQRRIKAEWGKARETRRVAEKSK